MGGLDPRAPPHEIAATARSLVGRTKALVHAIGRHAGAELESVAERLDHFARECGVRPVPPEVPLSPRILRMLDAPWWERNLRHQLRLKNEEEEQAAGHVRRSMQCYVTDHAVRITTARAQMNKFIMDGREVVNESGHSFNLGEVWEGSISNPAKRRSELMVRCRGFEEVARYFDHQAVFLTITAPSRFHRFTASSRPNPKWDEKRHSPRKTQDYLCKLWRRVCAALARHGIFPYGFRVAEPHHDGCPHWHLLLFVSRDQVGFFDPKEFLSAVAKRAPRESASTCSARAGAGCGLVGIAGAYALEDTPDEPGAIKHRYTVKLLDDKTEVDPLTGERTPHASGSATGYIAKYISKNIDGLSETGESVGLDFASGKGANDAAKRVRVWASTHRIRQFQQVGGPSVTVWREFRRLSNELQEPLELDVFEHARAAADNALWAWFWILQGGPDVRRKDLTLRPHWQTEEQSGKYGDDVQRVRGVVARCEEAETGELQLTTRIHTWSVQPAGQAQTDATQESWNRARSVLKGWGFNSLDEWEEFQRRSEAASPWTRDNNCTWSETGGVSTAPPQGASTATFGFSDSKGARQRSLRRLSVLSHANPSEDEKGWRFKNLLSHDKTETLDRGAGAALGPSREA
jgi:hypothetical protein